MSEIEDSSVRAPRPWSTHCREGHEYTPENLRTYRQGNRIRRKCLTCDKDCRSRRRRKKHLYNAQEYPL